MNRLKRELRRRGVKLECDYECLPFNGIQAVTVRSEDATYTIHHTSISQEFRMLRSGEIEPTQSNGIQDTQAPEACMEDLWGNEWVIYRGPDGGYLCYDSAEDEWHHYLTYERAYNRGYNRGYRD